MTLKFLKPASRLSILVLLLALLSHASAAWCQAGGPQPAGASRNDRNNWSAPTILEHWAKTGVGMQGRHRVHKSLPGARGQEEFVPVETGSAMQMAVPEEVPLNELGGNEDGTKAPGDCKWYYDGVIPAEQVRIPTASRGSAAQIRANSVRGLTGKRITDTAAYAALASVAADEVANLLNPETQARIAQASMQAQDTNTANAFAEVIHNQATSAIEYCASYLTNFTVDGGNRWNRLRDQVFVPIALLLVLPGAVLTQLKAIASTGNPVLPQINPLDGIVRSIVAIFMIPATYLVINYGIDLANSLTYSIDSEYKRQFGGDMYKDAICAQLRAFPSRQPSENRNAYDLPTAPMGAVLMGGTTAFARLEATLYANKIEDPCAGIYIVPTDRADETLPARAVAARLAVMASNMALATSWNVLCAFQMAYLYYLWCVGPIAAALWVWPMKQLKDALPSWIEGSLTICFWSLFWNTTILLMACFRGVDETGTVTMSALNFLATACVKSAFDFAGLIRSAGQQATTLAEQAARASGGSADGGGGRAPSDQNDSNQDKPKPNQPGDNKEERPVDRQKRGFTLPPAADSRPIGKPDGQTRTQPTRVPVSPPPVTGWPKEAKAQPSPDLSRQLPQGSAPTMPSTNPFTVPPAAHHSPPPAASPDGKPGASHPTPPPLTSLDRPERRDDDFHEQPLQDNPDRQSHHKPLATPQEKEGPFNDPAKPESSPVAYRSDLNIQGSTQSDFNPPALEDRTISPASETQGTAQAPSTYQASRHSMIHRQQSINQPLYQDESMDVLIVAASEGRQAV